MLNRAIFLDKINNFLAEKNLKTKIFEDGIFLSDPIEKHASWVFKYIYSKPYLLNSENIDLIPRYHHEIGG